MIRSLEVITPFPDGGFFYVTHRFNREDVISTTTTVGTPAQCQNPHGGRGHHPGGDWSVRIGDGAEWFGPIQARPAAAIGFFLIHSWRR